MILPPRIKWKISRCSQQVDDRLEKARSFFRTVWSRQRMCPACRALVDRRETVCPFCRERISSRYGAGFDRLLALVLPEQSRYTILLLGVNTLLYVISLAVSMRERSGELDARALFGSIDGYTLVRLGAKYGALISAGEWWRFVTPVFLHGSLLHFAMNSWVLYDLGPAVEALYGRPKFLVLYVLTGACGVVLSYLWYPSAISIGASGAIFGLIGAMITYGYRNRRSVGDSVRNMFVRWAIYGLLFGVVVPGLDNAAHLGGLAAGIVFGWLVPDMPSVTRVSIYAWKTLQTVVVLLVLFSFLMIGLRQPH